MNGFATIFICYHRNDLLIFAGILGTLLLTLATTAKGQSLVWESTTPVTRGVATNPLTEAMVSAYTPVSGWENRTLSDGGRISMNKGGDTMTIEGRSAVGAYVLKDPTTAEGSYRVTVTGFGTPKLSVEWEARADAFDNPGPDRRVQRSTEKADGRVGAIIAIPLSIVTPGSRTTPVRRQPAPFDLSFDWHQRLFLTLSDSGVSDGAASASSMVRFVDSSGYTSIFGKDEGLFKGASITESLLRKLRQKKSTTDLSQSGFGSYRTAGGGLALRLDLLATGEFVRGNSTATEIHAEGYIYGHVDIYIDRRVSSVEGNSLPSAASLGLE